MYNLKKNHVQSIDIKTEKENLAGSQKKNNKKKYLWKNKGKNYCRLLRK